MASMIPDIEKTSSRCGAELRAARATSSRYGPVTLGQKIHFRHDMVATTVEAPSMKVYIGSRRASQQGQAPPPLLSSRRTQGDGQPVNTTVFSAIPIIWMLFGAAELHGRRWRR